MMTKKKRLETSTRNAIDDTSPKSKRCRREKKTKLMSERARPIGKRNEKQDENRSYATRQRTNKMYEKSNGEDNLNGIAADASKNEENRQHEF